MDFETLLAGRRSIRRYKLDPVPRSVIDEIISAVGRRP